MENRQTKLVESVDLLFQTRVQFPPSPQYTKISPLWGDFCIYGNGEIEQTEKRRRRVKVLKKIQQNFTEGNSLH